MCPIDSSSSLREENAIVCCSMLGGLTASKCLCDEVGHAEPDLLHFITNWQQVCSTETLSKVGTPPSTCHSAVIVCNVLGLSRGLPSSVAFFCMMAHAMRQERRLQDERIASSLCCCCIVVGVLSLLM